MRVQDIFEAEAEASLRPAIRYQGKLYVGAVGSAHLLLYSELPPGGIGEVIKDEDNKTGFVTERGRFLNRNAAHQYAEDNDLLRPGQNRFGNVLTSEMLKSWVPMKDSF